MRRLVALIAVLFTFASVMGGTVAHAHRYVSTPIVVLNLVDEQNQSIPVVVQIQRGQIDLGAGIVMPFGPQYGIAIDLPALPKAPDCADPECTPQPIGVAWSGGQLLRPPISA